VNETFPRIITSNDILDAIVHTSKENNQNKIWSLAILMSGRPIEPLDDCDIAYHLLWKGNWLCSTWDLALFHAVFVAKKADGLANEFFFKKALDSVPSWNKRYPSLVKLSPPILHFDNFYEFLLSGQKLMLCIPK
jgi:hypothetical protein